MSRILTVPVCKMDRKSVEYIGCNETREKQVQKGNLAE